MAHSGPSAKQCRMCPVGKRRKKAKKKSSSKKKRCLKRAKR